MYLLGCIGLFFLAAITRGVVDHTHGMSMFANIVWIVVGILGVYFLGWLSLGAFIAGSVSAGFVRMPPEDH